MKKHKQLKGHHFATPQEVTKRKYIGPDQLDSFKERLTDKFYSPVKYVKEYYYTEEKTILSQIKLAVILSIKNKLTTD